jgi:hypothetical protein
MRNSRYQAPESQSQSQSQFPISQAMSHLQPRPIISHPCTVCNQPTHNWCSRCQATWYCSTEHLNADWRRHRTSCVPTIHQLPQSPLGSRSGSASASPPASMIHPYSAADSPPQPASSAIFSALFFPADEDRPRVVRVNCTPTSPRDQRPQSPQHAIAIAASAARPCQWEADTKPWLGGQPTGSVVLTHGLNGEPLRFPLHLFYVPDSLAKGTPVNRSIYKLTNGLAPRKWSGNVSLRLTSTVDLIY